MSNRNGQSDDYRYGFNGMEKDDEVRNTKGASYDFGARMLDPRIGRWLSRDAVTKEYQSDYISFKNNPIIFIDPDGNDDFYFNQHGKLIAVSHCKGEPKFYGVVVETIINSEGTAESVVLNYTQVELTNISPRQINEMTYYQPMVFREIWDNYKREGQHDKAKELSHDRGVLVVGRGQEKFSWLAESLFLILGSEAVAVEVVATKVVTKGLPVVKKVFKKLRKLFKKKKKCFIKGTKIYTNSGFNNIENIAVGDSVWSYNELLNINELNIVSKIFVHDSSFKLVKISFENEIIYSTPEHPFYINNKWVEAKDLKIDDSLCSFNLGLKYIINNIQNIDTIVTVYNFEVNHNHNYYVTEMRVLVHNKPKKIKRIKKGKESQRQKEVKHKGDGEGKKGKGAKGDKHTKKRSGRKSTKQRQKPGWKDQK